jgi:hypothetical protein
VTSAESLTQPLRRHGQRLGERLAVALASEYSADVGGVARAGEALAHPTEPALNHPSLLRGDVEVLRHRVSSVRYIVTPRITPLSRVSTRPIEDLFGLSGFLGR